MSACNKIVKKAFMKGGPPQYSLAHPAKVAIHKLRNFFFAILKENLRNSDQNNGLDFWPKINIQYSPIITIIL